MPPKAGSRKRRSPSEEPHVPLNLLGGAAVRSNLPPIPSKISTAYGSPVEAAPIRKKHRDNLTLKSVISNLLEDATQDDVEDTPSRSNQHQEAQTQSTPSSPLSSTNQPTKLQGSKKPQQNAPAVPPPPRETDLGSFGQERESSEELDFGPPPMHSDSEDELTGPVNTAKTRLQNTQGQQTEETTQDERQSSPKRARDEETEEHEAAQARPSKKPRTAPAKQPHLRVRPEETPPSGPRRLKSQPATPGLLSAQSTLPAGSSVSTSRRYDELNSLVRDGVLKGTFGSSAKASSKVDTPIVRNTAPQPATNSFDRLGPSNTNPPRGDPATSSPHAPPDTPTPGPSRRVPTRSQLQNGTPSTKRHGQRGSIDPRPPQLAVSGSGDPDDDDDDKPSSTDEENKSESDNLEEERRLLPRRRPHDPLDDSQRSRSRSPPPARAQPNNPLLGNPAVVPGRGLLGLPARSLWGLPTAPPAPPTASAPTVPAGYHTSNSEPRLQYTPMPQRSTVTEEDESEDEVIEEEEEEEEEEQQQQHQGNKPTDDQEDRQPVAGSGSAVQPNNPPIAKPSASQPPSSNAPRPGAAKHSARLFPAASFSRSKPAPRNLPEVQPGSSQTPQEPQTSNERLSLRNKVAQHPATQLPRSPLQRGMAVMRKMVTPKRRTPDGNDDPDDPGRPGGNGNGNGFVQHVAGAANGLRAWLAMVWIQLLAVLAMIWTKTLALFNAVWEEFQARLAGLATVWERFLGLLSYLSDTRAGMAWAIAIGMIMPVIILNWLNRKNGTSTYQDLFEDEDPSSFNPLSLVGRQGLSFSDLSLIPSTLARLVPLWVVRPGALWSSNSTYNFESKLREVQYALKDMTDAAKVQDSAISLLDKILPKLVHVPVDSEGGLKIQPAFFEALKDLISKDQDILTLNRGAHGVPRISDAHYQAVKAALDRDPTGVGLGKVEVFRVIEERAPSAWMEWVERNHNQVQKALLDAGLADAILKRAPNAGNGEKMPGIDASNIFTREQFLSELQQEFRKHHIQVMSDVKSFLDEVNLDQIQQYLKNALKEQRPDTRKMRQEVIDLVDERIKSLLGRAGLSSLAKSKINGLWESDLMNRINFFSLGSGAIIDVLHTSPDYEPPKSTAKFLSDGYKKIWRPKGEHAFIALQRWDEFGECWCGSSTETRFGQPNGVSLSVTIGHTIEPEYVVVEHIPPSRSLDPEAAPKDIEIWAHIEDAKLRQRAMDVSMVHMNPEGLTPYRAGYVQIGSFQYNAESAKAGVLVYRIPEVMQDIGFATDHITLRAVTNHGAADHTCFYRVRMYGKKVDEE